jgi:hypothetical protein
MVDFQVVAVIPALAHVPVPDAPVPALAADGRALLVDR